MTAVTPESPPELPIGRSLGDAYNSLFENLPAFAKIAAFPLLLYLFLPLANILLYPLLLLAASQVHPVFFLAPMHRGRLDLIMEQALVLIALMVFCSHWLQYLQATRSQRRTICFWSGRDPRFVAHLPLMLSGSLFAFAMALLIQYAQMLGFDDLIARPGLSLMASIEWVQMVYLVLGITIILVAFSVEIILIGRLAPAFAAAAAGKPMRLSAAWRSTKGKTLRAAALWFLLAWLPIVAMSTLQGHLDSLYLDPQRLEMVYRTWGGHSIEWLLTWRLMQLPSAIVGLAAMALGASLFLRLYKGKPDRRPDLLERFE